jgi:hemolysin III
MVKKEVKTEFKEKKRTLKREYRVQKKAYRAEKKRLKKEYLESMHAYYEQEGTTEVLLAPKRSILEEIGNAITHGLGAILSILAFLAMIFVADRASEYVAASIYFAGLFIMLLISCLYHSFPQGSTVKRVFRRFDYCCIYLLIGATFAPFLLCYLGGAYGITFFVVQWVIIALGVIMIAIFGPTRMRWLHYALYPLLGWSALLLIPPMLANHIGFFWYILLGGIIYSLGIIPFASKKASAHFIWHFFVLGGAAVQWVGIYIYLYLY